MTTEERIKFLEEALLASENKNRKLMQELSRANKTIDVQYITMSELRDMLGQKPRYVVHQPYGI